MGVDRVLMRVVVMWVMTEGVGGDVRREPVGGQCAGCEAKGQRSEQPDRNSVGRRRRGAEKGRRRQRRPRRNG